MRISTAWSTDADTGAAVQRTYRTLISELGGEPSLIIAYASVEHDGRQLMSCLEQLAPGVPVQGGTSCLGVMTSAGFHSADGVGLGLYGMRDTAGDYGVGAVTIGDSPRAAGAAAIEQAIAQAERFGEPPDLVWLTGVPGNEEDVLMGIQDVIGSGVPVAGGSTADNTVEGHWQQYANGSIYSNAVVVSALYPSVACHHAFHSGYSPTKHKGRVTKAWGRTLQEIDGKPAADVYNDWTDGSISEFIKGGNVLQATTLNPIGRQVGKVGGMPYHRLSHPESVTLDGEMRLFSNIAPNEEIVLMTGTRSSLISRAGRVARAALAAGQINPDQISGALVIYCAGCMLAVQSEMDQVAAGIKEALGGAPFMGAFTFGEQGCFQNGGNYHGNLMITVVVFE